MKSKSVKFKSKSREAYLLGDVNEENIRQLVWRIRDLIEESPNEKIIVYITSHGGSLPLAFAFYDFIKMMQARLTTVALGCADSAAVIILLAGQKRRAGKNTTFLMHHITRSWHKGVSFKPDDLKAITTDVEITSKLMAQIISEETGQPLEIVKAQIAKEVSLVSEEARDFGLIDEII